MKERIFILYEDNCDWLEIDDRKELDKQVKDGDIDGGDLIVISDNVFVAKIKVELEKYEGKVEDEDEGY